jgi:hypothetical protein
MSADPYCNLAEIFEGTLSLVDYYARRMTNPPASLEGAQTALRVAIADLKSNCTPEPTDPLTKP